MTCLSIFAFSEMPYKRHNLHRSLLSLAYFTYYNVFSVLHPHQQYLHCLDFDSSSFGRSLSLYEMQKQIIIIALLRVVREMK